MSYELQLPIQAEEIWSDERLNKDEFYAATYFLRHQENQQKPVDPDRGRQVEWEDHFLDRLALLFARVKKQYVPHNVTATTLLKEGSNWTVVITKNAGPQAGEEEFAGKLTRWFELGDEHFLNPTKKNTFWVDLLDFWQERIIYYAENAPKRWDIISTAKEDINEYFRKLMGKNFRQKDFDSDWEALSKLASESQLRMKPLDVQAVDPRIWVKWYNFWDRPRRQSYPPVQTHPQKQPPKPSKANKRRGESFLVSEPSQQREAIETRLNAEAGQSKSNQANEPSDVKKRSPHMYAHHFRKCLHYMEMLGMPVSIWKSLQSFEERREDNNVRITFVKKPRLAAGPAGDELDEKAITRVLNKWKTDGTVIIDVKRLLNHLQDEKQLFFHCELQVLYLLEQLGSEVSKHKFIGCSKLSCYMCWRILSDNQYKTRYSHFQIYSNCAYPFDCANTRIVETFAQIQTELIRSVTGYKDRKGPREPGILQIEPVHTERAELHKADAQKMIDTMVEDERPNEYIETESPYSKTPGGQSFHGQFAIVYEASRNREGNRYIFTPSQTFAVKEIRSNSPNNFNAVKEEIKKLRGLAHPNILVLEEAYYYRSDPCTIFLATLPWAPVSLEIFLIGLRKRQSTPGWYRPGHLEPWPSIIKQCLEGLNYLHNQPKPIKHKDLKPHNILLLEEIVPITRLPHVRPIIADFGISKHWVSGGWTENLGTYVFKAPEQLSRDPDSSVLVSDIWSLGCCFAFILALLHADVPCLIDLWRLVMAPTNENKENDNEGHEQRPSGFIHNIAQVKEILHSTGSHSKQSRMVIFVNEFRELVNQMLEENQGLRLRANAAHTQWLEVEARLQILALSLPKINIAVRLDRSTMARTLGETELRSGKDLVELCNKYFAYQLPLRRSWLRRQLTGPKYVYSIFFQRPSLKAPLPVSETRLQEKQDTTIDVSSAPTSAILDDQLPDLIRSGATWCSSAAFYQWLVQKHRSMEPRSNSMDSSWEFALVIADESFDNVFLTFAEYWSLSHFLGAMLFACAMLFAYAMLFEILLNRWVLTVAVMTTVMMTTEALLATWLIIKPSGRLSTFVVGDTGAASQLNRWMLEVAMAKRSNPKLSSDVNMRVRYCSYIETDDAGAYGLLIRWELFVEMVMTAQVLGFVMIYVFVLSG